MLRRHNSCWWCGSYRNWKRSFADPVAVAAHSFANLRDCLIGRTGGLLGSLVRCFGGWTAILARWTDELPDCSYSLIAFLGLRTGGWPAGSHSATASVGPKTGGWIARWKLAPALPHCRASSQQHSSRYHRSCHYWQHRPEKNPRPENLPHLLHHRSSRDWHRCPGKNLRLLRPRLYLHLRHLLHRELLPLAG